MIKRLLAAIGSVFICIVPYSGRGWFDAKYKTNGLSDDWMKVTDDLERALEQYQLSNEK